MKVTVTIPKHYSFIIDDDFIDNADQRYGVTVVTTPEGDFDVTGQYRVVKSLVADVTIDDKESIENIMDTMGPAKN